MARGKQICKILKEIRRQIAEANDIEYITSECRYKGDCLGTCPKCEAEVRYLEQQLRARSIAGKKIAVAGISAGFILMSGCSGTSANPSKLILQGDTIVPPVEQIEETDSAMDLEGEVPAEADTIHKEAAPAKETATSRSQNKRMTTKGVRRNRVPVCGEVDSPTNPDEKGIYSYSFIKDMPQFPGGFEEMHRLISEHLVYPEEQLKERVQGRVVVRFYVDTLGRVCEPHITSGINPALDNEALRVVRQLPKFIPGTYNGKKVNVYLAVTVRFKLPNDPKAQATD